MMPTTKSKQLLSLDGDVTYNINELIQKLKAAALLYQDQYELEVRFDGGYNNVEIVISGVEK